MRASICVALAFATTISVASRGLPAQSFGASNSSGTVIGADLIASAIRTDRTVGGIETPTGVGLRAQLSYGFNFDWAVFAAVQSVSMRTGTAESVTEGEFGARYTFLDENSPARPYAEAGLSFRQLRMRNADVTSSQRTVHANGGAITVTAGVQLFATPVFAFDVGLAVSSSRYGNSRINGERTRVLPGSVPGTDLRIGVRYFLSPHRELF